MTRRRKPQPKPQGKAKRKPAPKAPAPAPQAVEADPLADARIRPLLERYYRLAGVKQAALGPDHAELSLPQAERPFFRDRESLRVAFSLDALERDPDAEIAVLGSPFLAQVIEAIRARAARLSLGLIEPIGGITTPQPAGSHPQYGELVRLTGMSSSGRAITLVAQVEHLPLVLVDIQVDTA